MEKSVKCPYFKEIRCIKGHFVSCYLELEEAPFFCRLRHLKCYASEEWVQHASVAAHQICVVATPSNVAKIALGRSTWELNVDGTKSRRDEVGSFPRTSVIPDRDLGSPWMQRDTTQWSTSWWGFVRFPRGIQLHWESRDSTYERRQIWGGSQSASSPSICIILDMLESCELGDESGAPEVASMHQTLLSRTPGRARQAAGVWDRFIPD